MSRLPKQLSTKTGEAHADMAAATTTRAYLALLEREGLTAELGEASEGFSSEGPSQ